LLVVLGAFGSLPALVAAAFAPVVLRAFAGLRVRPGRPNLLGIGLLEIVYSLWFLVLLVPAMR
jgi:hypothetical protein